jgi:hypothetical protein
MASENLECPEARKSLLPYLAGELEGRREGAAFEAHVQNCSTCRELLGDRRKAMQVLLAVAEDREAELTKPHPLAALKGSKTTIAFTAIALALLGFSYFSGKGGDLLGEKVAESLPTAAATTTTPALKSDQLETKAAESAVEAPQSKVEPKISNTKAAEAKSDLPASAPEPPAAPISKSTPPESRVKAPAPAPKVKRAKPRPKAPAVRLPSVVVFDATGRKVGESSIPSKR